MKKPWGSETTVKEFWNCRLELHEEYWEVKQNILKIFYDNSKSIQSVHLGGKKSLKSKELRQELLIYSNDATADYKYKKSIILEQINRKDTFQKQLDSHKLSVHKIFNDQFSQ